MMRALVLVLVVSIGGCSDKLPSPPDPADYAKMTPDQKCQAVAPRAARCADELTRIEAQELSDDIGSEVSKELDKAFADAPKLDAKRARKVADVMCYGYRDRTAYTDAVIACWAEENCGKFAACVAKRSR